MLQLQILQCSQYLWDLFRHRKGVIDCCCWQAVWGENGHLCSSQIRHQDSSLSIWLLHPDAVSERLHTLLLPHSIFKKLEIGQGRKKWVETKEGSCQLPFCSPRTVKAESWDTPKLSFFPITDAVIVKGQLQQAGSIENLHFPGNVLELSVLQVRCPYVSSVVGHCGK